MIYNTIRIMLLAFMWVLVAACGGGHDEGYDFLDRNWEPPAQARVDGPVVYYDSAVPETLRYSITHLTQIWDLTANCVGVKAPRSPEVYWTNGQFTLDGITDYGIAQFDLNRTFIGHRDGVMSPLVKHEYVHLLLKQSGVPDYFNEHHQHNAFGRCS